MTSTTAPHSAGLRRATAILGDERFDRPTRLLRLQGWRGDGLATAVAAGPAHRLAPGFCAVGATGVAAIGSSVLALALGLTAVIGIFAPNHPVETAYNGVARRFGRPEVPPNRAAKRLACLLGTLFLGTSAFALELGATVTGQIIAGAFAAVAWFVTLTNLCVPSVIFVSVFGEERSTRRRLF